MLHNPWVTTRKAQMITHIKAAGIVFPNYRGRPLLSLLRTLGGELEARRGDMRSYIYQFTVSEDIANQFIRLRGLL